MHYYPFNIGNYRRETHHLSLLEHGIYRQLLDTYYLEEKPLCADLAKLMRTHCIRTKEEEKALLLVLSDFFTLTDDGYTHQDCDEKIAKYQAKSEKAAKSARARWGKDANAMRTHSEGNANQEPITNNHKPSKDIGSPKAPEKFNFKKTLLSLGVDEDVASTWLAVRRKKKATNSELALKGILGEIAKTSLSVNQALKISAENSWAGFKADWYENSLGAKNGQYKSASEKAADRMRHTFNYESATDF